MTTKSNLLKNGIASTIQKCIRTLEQLFLVPFFISAWGAAYYGEWLTLTIIPSVLAFSDLGFGTAASNTFVLRYSSGDRQGAADIGKTGFWVITSLIAIGIVISCISLITLKYLGVFDKSLIDPKDAILAVALMMASKLMNFYQQLYDAYFRSARKASLSMNLVNINSIAVIIFGFCVLYYGGGIVLFAMTNFVIALLFIPIYAFRAKRELRLDEQKTAKIKRQDINDTLKKGIGYLMAPLWQAIFFQGTTFIVRIVLGPTAVAVFNTVRTLCRSINQLYNIINNSVFPELQYAIGQGNYTKARKLFRSSVAIAFLLAIGGMSFLFLFGMWFYQRWTNNALNPPDSMWYIFIIGIGFNALWWNAGVVFRAVNKPYQLSIAGVIAALISVIFTYIFSVKWGLTGAAAGALVLDIILAFYVLPYTSKMIHQNLYKIHREFFFDLKCYLIR